MPSSATKLILASSSVYRRELLDRLQVDFTVAPADIDETPLPEEPAEALAARLAAGKASVVAELHPDALTIGSDQVAVCGKQILGKPGNQDNALQQLELCSGRQVEFLTAVCLLRPADNFQLQHIDRTIVQFRELQRAEIEAYLDKDQPWNCAGSFRSESLGVALFDSIRSDDPTGLIGLPLIWLSQALQQGGIRIL